MKTLTQAIEEAIAEKTGRSFQLADSSGMGGGCINDANQVTGTDGRTFFVKRNSVGFLAAFKAEAHALSVMADSQTIRVPLPIATCQAEKQSALILEFLPMGRSRTCDWTEMGRQLAGMHRHRAEQHGWDHDNWIGSTAQINIRYDAWVTFFKECRLKPQIAWARRKHLSLRKADKLITGLSAFFENYDPIPSLLHGDLWSGNAGFLLDGSPVIFDPASYYGDREADLAMTEMFGGFSPEFYSAYETEWSLDPGYRLRKQLYILYHTLNHFNIFGGGYGSQADSIINGLVSHL